MSWTPPDDNSHERAILLTLARLRNADRLDLLTPAERSTLLEQLRTVEAKRIASAVLSRRERKLSARDQRDWADLAALVAK